jgi:hypothetical protein
LIVPKEYLTERLKFLTEVYKLAWLSILATTGGSVSLLVGQPGPWKNGLVVLGVVVNVALAGVLWYTHQQMQRLWTDLKGG